MRDEFSEFMRQNSLSNQTAIQSIPGSQDSYSGTVELEEISANSTLANQEIDVNSLEDPYFASYPAVPSRLVIGDDDRIRVNDTDKFPWRAICSLIIHRTVNNKRKRYLGTGWFVGPRTIVTAGHNLYFHDEKKWAKSIDIYPGKNGSNDPFGVVSTQVFRSTDKWIFNRDENYDLGAIYLPEPQSLGNRTGFFGYGIRTDRQLRSSNLNLSGYPLDKGRGILQQFDKRKTKSVSANKIIYDIDTNKGQSGSPVWIKSGNNRIVVGIHTNGHSSGNSAVRITTTTNKLITGWKNLI